MTGLLGVGISTMSADYWYVRKYSPIPAIGQAIERSWTSIGFTVRMLSRMVTGEVSIKNISGPINIAQYAGNSAAAGINAFLNFLALVSISLGVLNLLPIPILDGGQIVYQSIEGPERQPAIGKITNIRAEDRHPGASASHEFRILQRHRTDNRVGTAPC